MLKLKHILFIPGIWLILALGGCTQQELPDPVEGEPVLYVNARIAGDEVSLLAGKDGYMGDASYGPDANGVTDEFRGSFEKAACRTCGERLQVIFRGSRIPQSQNPIPYDSVVAPGSFVYWGSRFTPDPHTFRFEAKSGGTPPFTYEWDFGDGERSSEPYPTHKYETSGDFEVSVKMTDAGGCFDHSIQRISAGAQFNPCQVEFSYSPLGNSTVAFQSDIDPDSIQNFALVSWDFGDGVAPVFFPMDLNPVYQYSSPGIYTVTLLYISPNGCPAVYSQNIYSEPAPSCASSIAYKTLNDDPGFSSVAIEWTNEQGDIYSSYRQEGQPDDSYFEVLEVKPYRNDTDGDKSLMVTLRFACELYLESDPSKSISVVDGETVIGIGYQE